MFTIEKSIEENKKKAEELLQLIAENPGLPLLPMVYYEVVGEDCGNWAGRWKESFIDHYIIDGEQIRFKSEEDANEMAERLLPPNEYENMTDGQIEKFYDSLPWKKAIIVYIDLPISTN